MVCSCWEEKGTAFKQPRKHLQMQTRQTMFSTRICPLLCSLLRQTPRNVAKEQQQNNAVTGRHQRTTSGVVSCKVHGDSVRSQIAERQISDSLEIARPRFRMSLKGAGEGYVSKAV